MVTPELADPLVDAYDAALFDLDGVIYLGPEPVPGAAEGIARLRARGVKLGFVTNNAARPPSAVAEHLRDLGIPAVTGDVVTSAQAGAHLLVSRFGPRAKVLVVGGGGLWAALAEVGLTGVWSADDDPVAVMQGYSPDLTWAQLSEAAIAIQRGAYWLATNTDAARPTDRGIVPGNGAAVAAVRMAVDAEPEVAGKPFRPLVDETMERLGARHPIFVGDNLDTDIAGAHVAGLDSLMVLTGGHGAADLLAARPTARPTFLGWDLSALLAPPLNLVVRDGQAWCGAMTASAPGGALTLNGEPASRLEAVAGLWAAAQLAWQASDIGQSLDPTRVLSQLSALR